MPKKTKQKKTKKGICNKNYTYHEYLSTKKARNHKARESWASVLNKLGEHCINLGQSLETAFRDYEGTSIILTSNGHDGPANDDFTKEGIKNTTKRFEETLRLSLINNKKKQLYENIQAAKRIRAHNMDICDEEFENLYKLYENDYERKKFGKSQLLMIFYPKSNIYSTKLAKNGSRSLVDENRFAKKTYYLQDWEHGGNKALPENVQIYKLEELGLDLDKHKIIEN